MNNHSKNSSANFEGLAILLIIAVVWLGFSKLYDIYSEPERLLTEEKEKAELIKYWSEPTINFMNSVDYKEFKHEDKNIKINKFFEIESYYYHVSSPTLNFENKKYLNQFYTRKIDDANVIIWIATKPGEVEGRYSNASKAVRYNAEISFIDKETKTVYKKEIIKYLGIAPEHITRKQGSSPSEEYFGTMPYEEIYQTIENEIRISSIPIENY